MQRMRAVLVRNDDNVPLDPCWNPLIKPLEIDEANARLAEAGSTFHWRWLHILPAVS